MRTALRVAAVSGLLCLIVSYGGMFHPLGDSLAVFRTAIAAFCLLCLIPLWQWRWLSWPALVLICLSIAPRVADGLKLQAASDFDFTVYQKNLSYRLRDPAPLIRDMISHQVDFVTVQEVGRRNRLVLAKLAEAYPSQHYCDFAGVGGTAVLSRWPAVEGQRICAARDGLTAMQVETPHGPVWVVSIHLHWPYPFGQAAQVERLLPILDDLEGPKVIGGDFNMVPWSHTMGRIARATDTRRVGHVEPTFELAEGPVGVAIDHVLSGSAGTGEIRLLDKLGSDHNGVLAHIRVAEAR